MKIPETSANIGAYYGNEENNGQWQANGVIIDSGVGGGVVGSGDAGLHRPPVYPVHIHRGHIPAGYMVAGAYYPPGAPYAPVPPAPQDDFADYMWMENLEEFDKQVMATRVNQYGVMQQLEEEALMEQCIEAMLEDEQRERHHRPVANGNHPHPHPHAHAHAHAHNPAHAHAHAPRHYHHPTTSNGSSSMSLEETVSRSTLNPLAAEFVPTRVRPPTQTTEEPVRPTIPVEPAKDETPPCTETALPGEAPTSAPAPTPAPTPAPDSAARTQPEEATPALEDDKAEVVVSEPTPADTTPEVSAADIQPVAEKTPEKKSKEAPKRDQKPRVEARKVPKPEPVKTKAKPQPSQVKSETKVQPKKKEVKSVRSEAHVEEKLEPAAVVVAAPAPAPATEPLPAAKPQASPVGESNPVTPEYKPINYAAAAKANKPKKATSPPVAVAVTVSERAPPPKTAAKPAEKVERKPKIDKPTGKTDKALPRKNSAK